MGMEKQKIECLNIAAVFHNLLITLIRGDYDKIRRGRFYVKNSSDTAAL